MGIDVRPATADRFDDVATLLAPSDPSSPACWCLTYRVTIAGWCALGPRSEMGRLQRSRTIPEVGDVPVWSIVCFVVRPGHRRKGVAAALLAGAIDYAAANGATVLESYPIDTDGRRVSGTLLFVGTTSMFERAGFERVVETSARSAGRPRWLMRLELADRPA